MGSRGPFKPKCKGGFPSHGRLETLQGDGDPPREGYVYPNLQGQGAKKVWSMQPKLRVVCPS